MFNLCGLFSGFPIAEKPLSTPEVETERARDGIRESRGNELTTKLRVRERVWMGGKGAKCRKELQGERKKDGG
jgi:hypothetical protein